MVKACDEYIRVRIVELSVTKIPKRKISKLLKIDEKTVRNILKLWKSKNKFHQPSPQEARKGLMTG